MYARPLLVLSCAIALAWASHPVPLASQSHCHVAFGVLYDHVDGGSSFGPMAHWKARHLGSKFLGIDISLGVRGFLAWGSEPRSEAGRRSRWGVGSGVILNLSDPAARTRFQLSGGLGYTHYRVSGVTEMEFAANRARANTSHGGLSSHSGFAVMHAIEKQWHLYGEMALNGEGPGSGGTALQVMVGVSYR